MDNVSVNGVFEPYQEPPVRRVEGIILFVFFAVGLTGNGFILGLLLRKQLAISETIQTLLLNLLVADLFVAIFCTMISAIWEFTVFWYGGDFLCRASMFLQALSIHASSFLTTSLAIDRCITRVFSKSKLNNTRRTWIMAIIAWIAAAVLSIPQVCLQSILFTKHFIVNWLGLLSTMVSS